LKYRKVVAIPDVRNRQLIERFYPGLGYLRSREETRSELAVPIVWRGDPIGVLNFEHTQVGSLPRFATFVQSLAEQAAFNLYNIRNLRRQRLLGYDELMESISAFVRAVRHNLERRFDEIRRIAEDWNESRNGEAFDSRIGKIRDAATEGLREATALVEMAPHLGQPVKPVMPVHILRSVIDTMKAGLGKNIRISLTQNCSQDLTVLGRENVLVFCFTQILENCAKHGASTADISIGSENSRLTIVVSDNGPGVPKGCLEEIFTFKRDKLQVRGRGDAMPLCRVFIGHMSGEIWSEAASPRGLRTVITLPLVTTEAERTTGHDATTPR